MILVILAVSVLIIGVSSLIFDRTCSDVVEGLFFGTFILGIVGALASIVVSIVLIGRVASLPAVDDTLAMYQEENAKIEQQISTIVEDYKKYETDTFEKVTPDSAITQVVLYPELKSNTLVESQIQVYVSNNEKIKELQEEQIMGSIYRWWLYFGH